MDLSEAYLWIIHETGKREWYFVMVWLEMIKKLMYGYLMMSYSRIAPHWTLPTLKGMPIKETWRVTPGDSPFQWDSPSTFTSELCIRLCGADSVTILANNNKISEENNSERESQRGESLSRNCVQNMHWFEMKNYDGEYKKDGKIFLKHQSDVMLLVS